MDEKIGQKLTTEEAMRFAISEAYKGAPYVSPNPLVGCVILDSQGCFLQSGYHHFFGGPHAEIEALKGLTPQQLKDAHVIVTLEPCAHEGKTPSCAKALAALPIAKVTFGLVDPNPLVAGQGAEILRAAGKLAEEFPRLKNELEQVCEVFLKNFRHQSPDQKMFVALKVASSLDGQMALKTGESKWITSEASRLRSHSLRACYDAILVGSGTVRTDDPSLNIRHSHITKKNKVVVLDPEGELLPQFSQWRLSKLHSPENLFWCVKEDLKFSDEDGGPTILKIKSRGGEFDLSDLLAQLYQQGLRSVFVEGGSYTLSRFIRSGRADRLYLFLAPTLLGAGGGLSWTKDFEISEMNKKIHIYNLQTEAVGGDFLISGSFHPGPRA